MFKLLHDFKRMRRQCDPRLECGAPRRVDAHVLQHETVAHACVGIVAQERDRGAREVERPAVIGAHDLHAIGIGHDGSAAPTGGGAEVEAVIAHHGNGARHRVAAHERLVALHIDDDIVRRVLGSPGDLGHAVRPRRMPVRGEDSFCSMRRQYVHDFLRFGGGDDAVGKAETLHPFPHADHQWGAAEGAQGLPGEPGGTQAGGNHGQDAQVAPPEMEYADAKITPRNIRLGGRMVKKRASRGHFGAQTAQKRPSDSGAGSPTGTGPCSLPSPHGSPPL